MVLSIEPVSAHLNRTTSRARPRSAGSRSAQVEEQVRALIRSARARPGARLPSTRALAADLGVSRGVVVSAYAQLAAEGFIRLRPGAAPLVAVTGRAAEPVAVRTGRSRSRGPLQPPTRSAGLRALPARRLAAQLPALARRRSEHRPRLRRAVRRNPPSQPARAVPRAHTRRAGGPPTGPASSAARPTRCSCSASVLRAAGAVRDRRRGSGSPLAHARARRRRASRSSASPSTSTACASTRSATSTRCVVSPDHSSRSGSRCRPNAGVRWSTGRLRATGS